MLVQKVTSDKKERRPRRPAQQRGTSHTDTNGEEAGGGKLALPLHPILKKGRGPSIAGPGPRPTARFVSPHGSGDDEDGQGTPTDDGERDGQNAHVVVRPPTPEPPTTKVAKAMATNPAMPKKKGHTFVATTGHRKRPSIVRRKSSQSSTGSDSTGKVAPDAAVTATHDDQRAGTSPVAERPRSRQGGPAKSRFQENFSPSPPKHEMGKSKKRRQPQAKAVLKRSPLGLQPEDRRADESIVDLSQGLQSLKPSSPIPRQSHASLAPGADPSTIHRAGDEQTSEVEPSKLRPRVLCGEELEASKSQRTIPRASDANKSTLGSSTRSLPRDRSRSGLLDESPQMSEAPAQVSDRNRMTASASETEDNQSTHRLAHEGTSIHRLRSSKSSVSLASTPTEASAQLVQADEQVSLLPVKVDKGKGRDLGEHAETDEPDDRSVSAASSRTAGSGAAGSGSGSGGVEGSALGRTKSQLSTLLHEDERKKKAGRLWGRGKHIKR